MCINGKTSVLGALLKYIIFTFSIFLDNWQFKTLWPWLCFIDKDFGIGECTHQIWGQLIGIPFIHLSGFTRRKWIKIVTSWLTQRDNNLLFLFITWSMSAKGLLNKGANGCSQTNIGFSSPWHGWQWAFVTWLPTTPNASPEFIFAAPCINNQW